MVSHRNKSASREWETTLSRDQDKVISDIRDAHLTCKSKSENLFFGDRVDLSNLIPLLDLVPTMDVRDFLLNIGSGLRLKDPTREMMDTYIEHEHLQRVHQNTFDMMGRIMKRCVELSILVMEDTEIDDKERNMEALKHNLVAVNKFLDRMLLIKTDLLASFARMERLLAQGVAPSHT